MKAHDTLWGYCTGDQWLEDSTRLYETSHDSLFSLAQGRPECSRRTCMLVCAFFCALCTRDRGCSAHPVFPAPSVSRAPKLTENLGRSMPRERRRIPTWLLEIEVDTNTAVVPDK